MVKSYLRFEPDAAFGVIASNSNVIWLPPLATGGASAGRALVGALESVVCWDVKTGERISKWNEASIKAEVTAVAAYADEVVAVGYSDGAIRVWDARTGIVVVSFNGHKSAVVVLKFDESGTRLASGSRDTNVIVWDLISETGLYRLRGHKEQITGLEFVNGEEEDSKWLLSTAKDGFIKLWDLSAQHCLETHVAHRGECWALAVSGTVCMTAGGSDSEIKVWELDVTSIKDGERISQRGILRRQSKDRAVTLAIHPTEPFIACHGTDRAIEIWRIRSEDEVKKSIARKRRRRKEKLVAQGVEGDEGELDVDLVNETYIPFVVVRTPAKVRSIDWALSPKHDSVQILVSLSSNCLETYTISVPEQHKKSTGPAEYSKQYGLELAGHRTDVRALSLSSDDTMIASASNGGLKVWNVKTTNCIRTLDCGYALCVTFLPGDLIVVVGTKSGQIEMYDVASSSLLDTIDAHDGALWSLDVGADGKSMITGSADKSVKFWEFRIVQDEIPGTRRTVPRMKLKHTRTLELTDDVLCARLSPDGKYVAVSLLDNTIKVFFVDTLKFFLNLYGHKLPVLSMAVSFDSKILISCSADKNIKIWGLDFGDCHRSIFAHNDSIMGVQFMPDSHNFFSVSKDRLVKYWDGNKFENIQKLEGHISEVWALAVAHSGEFVVSASHDKSIRIWEQTDDQVFLEEEREREMEEMYESTLVTSLEADDRRHTMDDDDNNQDEVTTAAGKQTVETLVAGERIAEALELGVTDLDLAEEYATKPASRPQRHVVFASQDNISAERYVLNVVESVKPAQLQDALLLLPFHNVVSLLRFINIWTERGWNVTLSCRVLFFLIRIYYKQIIATETMRPMLDSVRQNLRDAVKSQRSELGFNIAGLKYVSRAYENSHVKDFQDMEEQKTQAERGMKKRAFITA
ncbi:WD40-repeat-containing domain protein [Lipomyces arxii]|uniref:WD40-repeat-containing domain protein n=1 Tax=Lipomyces arxii TaxID=56418 RepID=UPI0034CD3E1B